MRKIIEEIDGKLNKFSHFLNEDCFNKTISILIIMGLLTELFLSNGKIGSGIYGIFFIICLIVLDVFIASIVSYNEGKKIIAFFGLATVIIFLVITYMNIDSKSFNIATSIGSTKITISNIRDIATCLLTSILLLIDSINEKQINPRVSNFQIVRLLFVTIFLVVVIGGIYYNHLEFITYWNLSAYGIYYFQILIRNKFNVIEIILIYSKEIDIQTSKVILDNIESAVEYIFGTYNISERDISREKLYFKLKSMRLMEGENNVSLLLENNIQKILSGFEGKVYYKIKTIEK